MSGNKETLLKALDAFIKQRPGLEYGNYGSRESYFSEYRQILKDKHHAETLLRFVAMRDSITYEMLVDGFHAFSGRLTWKEHPKRPGAMVLDYCAGQYFPTEYRKAVCAVLAQTIWDWLRPTCKTGDDIRKAARRELGAAIANRWFN